MLSKNSAALTSGIDSKEEQLYYESYTLGDLHELNSLFSKHTGGKIIKKILFLKRKKLQAKIKSIWRPLIKHVKRPEKKKKGRKKK
jgi:hypothetical protein